MLIAKATPLFIAQIRQYDIDSDLDRVLLVVQVLAVVEVMLIDHRTAIEALRPEYEVEGLTNRRLANVIAANEKRMRLKGHPAIFDPAKILDTQIADLHPRDLDSRTSMGQVAVTASIPPAQAAHH